MPAEGYIQFALAHDERPLERRRFAEPARELLGWRTLLALTGLIGQEAGRYEGAGYGNLSLRVGPPSAGRGRRAFLVTCTQTSGAAALTLDDLALVERYDHAANRVWSSGPCRPSSESLTHAALYDVGPQIRTVFHGHSPALWRRAGELGIPVTDPAVTYGTPEMAREVQRLYRETVFGERKIAVMGGHEDGILVFGRSPEEAGSALMRWLARACRPAL